jgi:Tfp pilus assembly protein PilF
MKTKEIAFTLPVVLVVYEFLFFEGAVKKRLLLLAPFFLTLLIIPVSLVGTGGPIGSMIGDMSESTRLLTPMSRWAYLFTEFRVIATYLRLIFLPVNQNLDYDYPLYPSFMHGEVLLSFLLLAAIIGLGIYCYRRSKTGDARLRFVSFGIFWFFTTLSVESSVIPIVDVIFEHRVYLPSVGAFIAISALLAVLWGRMEREGALIKTVVMTVPVVIIIVLAGATYARNAVWQDKAGLWEDVVRKSPNKARAYRNLAYYVADTDSARAMELYAQALMLDPLNAHAYNNRGLLLYKAKRYEEAVDDLSKAIVVDPNFAAAYNNRGIVRYGTGSLEQALDDFSTAIRLNPFYADAYSNRGSTYGSKGDLDKALEDFSAAISLSPEKDGYYVNRAIAYSRSGRVNEALADYRKACALGNAMACEYLENRPKQQE